MPDKGLIAGLILTAAVMIWLLIVIFRDSRRFVTVTYRISSPVVKRSCRIVMLSDLHNKEYGADNSRLIQAIRECRPDMILVAGDMFTANEEKNSYNVPVKLLKQLTPDYPVYYGMGNHEYRVRMYREAYGDTFDRYMEELKQAGVQTLENERIYLPGYNMEICGLEIERCYYKRFHHTVMDEQYLDGLLGKSRMDCMEILIAHNPDYFENYTAWGADLILSGHVHGGVVRLPVLGGVISPSVHLFPKYDGGSYQAGEKTMILGRGLGMHTIPVRVFNPGELVVIDVERQGDGQNRNGK